MSITVPAARVIQGDLSLYTTSLKVEDLIRDGFYRIDRLDPEIQGKGYQRVLQDKRAKRLASYIIDGQETKDAFLPTSVFLATHETIDFNEEDNTITFDTDKIGEFNVVDGQHRLEGLKMAAEKDERVLKFQIPVNIAHNLPFLHQMCHFLIVNTTQKSVDKGIEQQIISRLTESDGLQKGMTLPKWIQKIVDKKEIDMSYKLVKYLNDAEDSPWKGKVQMANESKTSLTTTNQASFVSAIDKFVMVAGHPLRGFPDSERARNVFLNYWKAIAKLLEPEEELKTNLYRSAGILVFSIFSADVLRKLRPNKDYSVETIEKNLKECFDNMEGEYEGIGNPEWWLSGTGSTVGINSAIAYKIVSVMADALIKSDEDIIL